MEVAESEVSRRNQLASLVARYCGELVMTHSSEARVLHFWKRKVLIGRDSEEKLTIAHIGHRPDRIFENGQWHDIEIAVLDGSYFEASCNIARDYETLSNMRVVVVRRF